VDKRLTLKQVISHIKFLQDKKGNSSHKNNNAKNYFSCNDISKKNLGFIEFTDVVYHQDDSDIYLTENKVLANQIIKIKVKSLDSAYVSFSWADTVFIHTSNQKDLLSHLESNLTEKGDAVIITQFNENLSFQDYITFKSLLSQINFTNVTIAHDEFIFN
jgi:biopolymer transport protein ExbD